MTSSESSSSRSPSPSPIPSPASAAASGSSIVISEEGIGDGHVDHEFLALFKEAIGKIKGQKQRPSFDRLCQALKHVRKGTRSGFVQQQLQYAIRDGHMFMVYSNGKESYKDTENLRKLRKFTVKSDSEVRRAVKFAIREVGDAPNEAGITEELITRYIECTFKVENPEGLPAAVTKAINHLLAKSDLEKKNNRYILAKELVDEKEKNARARSSMNSDDASVSEVVVTKKKKKKKKMDVHDGSPSINSEDILLPSTSKVKPVEKKKEKKEKKSKIQPNSTEKVRDKTPERRLSTSKSPEKKSSSKAGSAVQEMKTPIKDEPVDARSATPKKNVSDDKWSKKSSTEKSEKDKQTSISPSPKLRFGSDERTPKLVALLEDRRSAVRSPDVLLRSPIRKRSISDEKAKDLSLQREFREMEKIEKTMGPPSTINSNSRTKKSFQKATKLNELIRQKPLNLSMDRDEPMPSTSSGMGVQKTEEEAKKVDDPPKKKRGRPFKKKPLEEPRKKSGSRSSSRAIKSSDEEVPDGILDPGFEESIPKELRDGLTKYFTPSLKRKSRVAINTLLSSTAGTTTPKARSRSSKKTTDSETTEDDARRPPALSKKTATTSRPKEKKIVKVEESSDWESEEPVEKPRRASSSSAAQMKPEKKRGKKCGSTQLKSLQDGLTKFFTVTGDRKRRPPPSYVGPVYRRRREAVDSKGASERSHSDSSKGPPSKPRSKQRSEDVISPTGSTTSKFKVPDVIPTNLEELFRKARDRALKKIPTVAEGYDGPLPPRIQLGDKKIKTWYTSPFPEEYIRCKCLYMCEFCLQYMKTLGVLKSHYEKCPWHRPPGAEIYHDTVDVSSTETAQELVIYETDGNDWKEYCQNICLLAKLYLDHKTLYYDVEPFLFYVLCRRDKLGDHLIGYFSKEKNSPQRYNVSCIMVLPPFQGDGYGRFLIDFSYLLSRVEAQHGTPEKPLSEMGQWSYNAYWRSAVLDFFLEQRNKSSATTSIKAICDATGMWPQDVADTLQGLNFITKNEDTLAWEFNLVQDVLDSYQEKKTGGKKRIPLHADKLRWDPWKGDVPGVTTTESDHSGSHHADQLVDTGDDQKADKRTSASSESEETDQAKHTSPPPHSKQKSKSKTPPKPAQRSRTPRAGRQQSSHKSSSRERSPRPTPSPPPSALSPTRRKSSAASTYPRRRGRTRDVFGGRRRKRRGKFRSRPTSSTATSSQPKNYKGRREELRAGSDKRRKQHHGRPADHDDSGEESDISSCYTGAHFRRSSMSSESSADESLASEPTRTFSRGSKQFVHKDTGHESSSSASEVSSSRSLSHLDQPPRAPHPPEPVDTMDQGISTDSPPLAIEPPTRHHPLSASAASAAPQHRVAEICIQTEPVELTPMPAPVLSVPVETVPETPSHLHPEYSRVAEIQSEALNSQVMGHMPTGDMPQASQTVAMGQSMPLSPSMHLQQPHTPYRHQQASPMVGSIPSVNKPASVLSMHDQMQDTEMIMSQPQYEPPYDQYATPQHTPGLSATSPQGFQHQHQQASPVAAQPPASYVSTYQESPRSQQPPTPYHDILRPPHTPTTPVAAAAASVYMNPSPRPTVAFTENVSSPHAPPRMLQTPMPYQDPYGTPVASVVGFEQQTRAVHGSGHGRVQQQAYPDCAQAQESFPVYNQKVMQQQQQQQPPMQHHMHSQQQQQQQQQQRQQTTHHQPSRKTKQRANEQPAPSTNYPQVNHQQVPQSPIMFHPSSSVYGHPASGMMMPFPGMQDQYSGYSMGMQPPADTPSIAKLAQLTHGLSAAQHPHMGIHSYNVGAAAMAAGSNQRGQSSQASRQSQHPQHQMPAPAGPMQMPGAPAMQYHSYLQKTMQTYPGQQPVMTASYPQSFFHGQGVPMPGQVQMPPGQYRPVGPNQAQSMYPGYAYYAPGAQHPHAPMRQ
ncbi:histone acetyltransferase lsy-12-like [Paramacrobiotus metropolitanus]|uniref:histone acetyltransferase lsy-12-like n=1 Tax=Paramacrobiotus metropolitanus TaxID=2943436 RepID=UPI002445E319|nr:histone acetyltransferase lsy-12-like [Paramacrobiotus metropolitanus]